MSDNQLHSEDKTPAKSHEHLYWYVDDNKPISDETIRQTHVGICNMMFRFISDGGNSPYKALRKLACKYASECHYHNMTLYAGKPRAIYSCGNLSIKQILPILTVIETARRDLVEGVDYLDIPANYNPAPAQANSYRSILYDMRKFVLSFFTKVQ